MKTIKRLPQQRVSQKMIDAENFVDKFISKNGKPPTYGQVGVALKIKETAVRARLRHCLWKMKSNQTLRFSSKLFMSPIDLADWVQKNKIQQCNITSITESADKIVTLYYWG